MEPALPPDDAPAPRVVDLRDRRSGADPVAVVARLGATEAERDRLNEELGHAHAALQAARADLAERVAAEAALVGEVAVLRSELAGARARAEAFGSRDGLLARLAGELVDAARAARLDVEVHLSARAAAEARLAAAEGELAAERARAARAEAALRRRLAPPGGEEPAALVAARDRVRSAAVALPAPAGLADGLDRAAERLRHAAPETPVAGAPRRPAGRARRVLRRLFG